MSFLILLVLNAKEQQILLGNTIILQIIEAPPKRTIFGAILVWARIFVIFASQMRKCKDLRRALEFSSQYR